MEQQRDTHAMKAAFIEQTGDPDVIKIGELSEDKPARKQVRIRVRAVSVNPIDTYIRSGAVAADLPNSYIPGCDAAGIIESVEKKSRTSKLEIASGAKIRVCRDDRVRLGTYLRETKIGATSFPNKSVMKRLPPASGGCHCPSRLFREARLQAGETVLCIGGTGGVGSMVMQMAKASARVLATAGSEAKCQQLLALGADVAINYQQDCIQTAVLDATSRGRCILGDQTRT